MEARKRISKSIIKIMDVNNLPFYAELMMRSKILPFPKGAEKQREHQATMAVAVDGNIYYDEDFVQTLSDEELNWVLLHETAHKAYLHLPRVGKRDRLIWNIAADVSVDYEVEHVMCRSFAHAKKPKGRIVADTNGSIEFANGQIKLENVHKKSVEELYVEIEQQMPKQPNKKGGKGQGSGQGKQGQGSGKHGQLGTDVDDHDYSTEEGKKWEDMSDHEREETAENAKDDVIEAATKCKKRGVLPKGIERMIDRVMRAKINWRQYIWRHVVNELPYDQTLTRPNRRFLTQGLYIPGTVKENVDIVAMIDLSGSIGKQEMADFVHLMTTITNQFNNVNITILSHDSKVQAVTEITMANAEKIRNAKYQGGGGTDHRPCFEWVKENKRNTPLIVAFTDGYTCFPKKSEVNTPTIWVISRDGMDIHKNKVPFGIAIKMEDV